MRIYADASGMDIPSFGSITSDVSGAIADYAGPLSAAGNAAGDAGLASAISDLCDALRSADGSAALTLTGLSKAVARAAAHYSATDRNVARAATPR